jgi:cytochrome P450
MLVDRISNVPHVPRYRALLDARELVRHPVHLFERYRQNLGPTFSFHFGGAQAALVSTDPDLVQHVLKGNHANYRMSDIRVERMAEFQGKGLLNSHGEAWLRQRRLLSQGFRRSRLSALLPLQVPIVEGALDRLEPETRHGPVDVHRVMLGLTFRLMGKALFGGGVTDEEIDRLGRTILTIQAFMVRQIVQPYLIPWFRLSGASRRHQALREAGDQVVRDHIEAARKSGSGGADLLAFLLETPYPDTGEHMSGEQMLIESLQLLVAGNETSPVTLSWTLYLLGRNPAWVGRIRDEVDDVFGSGPITLDGLHRLPLTLQVLDEAMRLYPPFWMIDRVAIEDDEAAGVRIPAGTTVVPYIYGIHRNPTIWNDPETFDPGRFEKPRRTDRHPFAHLPFGGGPRICIGSNLAVMQVLLILVTFIRKYDFNLASCEPVQIRPMMILHPEGPIRMHLRRVG